MLAQGDKMVRAFQSCLFLLTASLLVACGGGGGGGSTASSGSPGGGAPGSGSTASPVALSTTNASAAAASVEDALFLATGTSGQGAAIPIGVVVSGASRFNLSDFLSTQFQTINQVKAGVLPTPLGATTVTNISCSGGGTIGVSLDDIDDSGDVSTGDTFTMSFNSCQEDGSTLNGSMSVANLVVTQPTPTAYTYSGSITINSLAFSDGADSGTMSGTINFAESSSDSVTVTSTLSISSLTATLTGETLTISALSATVTENLTTGAYTLVSNGTINSSKLGGVVTFTTPTALKGFGTAYPSSGAIKISGSNSSITLTALSSTNVRLDIDSNNDGTTDSTMNSTWAALEAA